VADGAGVALGEALSPNADALLTGMLSDTGAPLAYRAKLRPGRFIAQTDRALFVHSGPKKIDQQQEIHVLAGTFVVSE